MKFIVSSTKLSSHLQAISRVIASKSTLPILECFLLSLKGKVLTITTSDLETTLITSLEVEKSEGQGLVAISAKILLDSLRELPEQPLEFDINNDNLALSIKYETGIFNFIGQNGDEYPKLPELSKEANELKIDTDTLNSGITKSIFATADDELRPVMNGIYFDITTEGITMVATDAHKLVRVKTTAYKGSADAAFILAKKPATLLKNILPKESGEVSVQFDEKNTVITLSNYKMICRQVEGRYPNYNGVIPQNNPHKLIIDRLAFMNALKRVSIFSNQASNLIKLQLTENAIHITAQDIDFSVSAEENISCQYSGEPMSIGFKSTFLIDILNNINSGDVVLELADPSRAGLILPFENDENEDLLMLLMPMLLND
ncbi:MAG: DNA polymerase III subunit beta [Paludibacteraceae bacterium]|nr:DNA polymerase III subunit beta [Paludibacteraceae bacterium]MBN2788191.1 DNA polymerase III subunit beta [Paludibacteraceae bacterium]